MKKHLITSFALFFILLFVQSLTAEGAGFIPVRNFIRREYKGGPQNWDLVQDSIGRIYVGNRDGMLSYDGLNWKSHPIGNYTTVRSLLYDEDKNRIYAGGSEEFGYFQPDSINGNLKYHSLLPLFGKIHPLFTEVWKIMSHDGSIWFQSDFHIFNYDGQRLRTIPVSGRILRSAVVDGYLLVALEDGRIQYMDERTLKDLPNTELLADKQISAILPSPERGTCMFVTAVNGIYLYDGKGVRPYVTHINDFLKQNQVFSAAVNGDDYVFGTVGLGAIVQNIRTGKTKYINKENGLQNNTVLNVEFDNLGNIWLCLDNGLDYALYNFGIRHITGRGNDIGAGYASLRQGNILYLGTNQGLYTTNYPIESSPIPSVMNRELTGQVWNITSDGTNVIVAGDRGLYQGSKGNFKQISNIGGTYKFQILPGSSSLALASTYDRFHLLRRNGNEWTDLGALSGFDDKGGFFHIDRTGHVYLSHFRKGIYRLHIDTIGMKIDNVNLIDADAGLPGNHNNQVEIIDGQAVISTADGLYTFDSTKGKMARNLELNTRFHTTNGSKLIKISDNLVVLLKENISIAKRMPDGSFKKDSTSFLTRENQLIPGFENLTLVGPHELIVSYQEGFWQVDTDFEGKWMKEVRPFIDEVTVNRDSVVYRAGLTRMIGEPLKLPYEQNSVTLMFGYPDYTSENAVEFSSLLEGFETEWTPFSRQTQREFTHLHEGDYTFRLRSRDVRTGRIAETSYEFSVLPPWYRTTAAKLVYAVLIIVGIIIIYLLSHRYIARVQKNVEKQKEAELETLRRETEREALQKDYEIATLKSDQLEEDIRHKSSELSNTTLNLIRKNEILNEIGSRLTKLQEGLGDSDDHKTLRKQIGRIKSSISDNISQDEDMERFKEYFDIVYVDFSKRLYEKHPNLSVNDRRLCCYIRMGLSSKEIAPLINISFKSVEMARYRLRKKMDLDTESNLTTYLASL